MTPANDLIKELSEQYQQQFRERRVILPFREFLQLVEDQPRWLLRNAAEYIGDTFDYFGRRDIDGSTIRNGLKRFKIFDLGTDKNGPIVGGELVQEEIYRVLRTFRRQGYADKLLLLHGPNGSAKTSTVESIAHAMQRYSATDEGAVYRFNWIFPTDKDSVPHVKGESGPIGFGSQSGKGEQPVSYALLDDAQIASKIHSEFKDNPIYLLPMPQREIWLREVIGAKENIKPDDVTLPPHILFSGLSKRNQLIFENLLSAYDGDLAKVFRHVQVERFFYSRQYRVGVSTVEPQMHLDAGEKLLTMDKNIQNLPSVLHNIRFTEAEGQLVEANRGMLEFSDLLKRPVEAFKYLLTSVEKSAISLPSATTHLDIVFVATTNEKHLDTFKTIPDFSSFRGRFELITVPYLLRPTREKEIYKDDIESLGKSVKIAPHAAELLCTWAVMTRLKQPDPEVYDSAHRALIARLDPRSKVRLYEAQTLKPNFKQHEENLLKELRQQILSESVGMVVYEGRFGASPREVRQILQRASQNPKHKSLTPMAIFDELERIVKDRTVYEFLQFEPRGKYHDAPHFINIIKDEFCDVFEWEILRAMTLVEEAEYEKLLSRYIDNVVATVKKERIFNPSTESYEQPSESLMKEIEKVIGIQGSTERHRDSLLSRIAAYRIDHPSEVIDVTVIFDDMLQKIQDHYFSQRKKALEVNFQVMLALDSGAAGSSNYSQEQNAQAEVTYKQLEDRFGYDRQSARECLKFMIMHNKTRKK